MPQESGSFLNRNNAYDTSDVKTEEIGMAIEAMHSHSEGLKRTFARRWYDNNFFDDGYHFRYISRLTGRIVDVSSKGGMSVPKRSIPKASRQLRGVANLLLSFDFHPVIYPARIDREEFQPDITDPMTGEVVKNPYYVEAQKKAREIAKKKGWWLEDEWLKQRMFEERLPLMLLLSMKNSVGWMQIWMDAQDQEMKTQVYDAFDIDVMGQLTDPELSPFIGKCTPKLIREIKSNPIFDEAQREKVNPDNRLASSEIKEAYLRSKFGTRAQAENTGTVIQKEHFIKETLNEDNFERISQQEDADQIISNAKIGDTVMRHVFSCGGVWLLDEYIPGKTYPFVDCRMEPGAIYQTPLMERFIEQNKSIDNILSRVEHYVNTSPMGIWAKRKGETYKINNSSFAQVIEYEGAPPLNIRTSPLAADPFTLIQLNEGFMEEQGVTTTALGKIPAGVKANAAIESLKASEFANLTMPMKMLQLTVKKVAEKMMELADRYYVDKREVSNLVRGESNYFDVMGKTGYDLRTNKLNQPVDENTIILNKDDRVRIEVETGSGYTVEGKRANMLDLSKFLQELAANQLIPPDAIKVVIERLLETYQFGSTSEFMEAFNAPKSQSNQFSQQQLDMIKVAILEVEADKKKMGQQQEQSKPVSQSISFKDLPPEGQAQMAAQAGIQLSPTQIAIQKQQEAYQQDQMERDREEELFLLKQSSQGTEEPEEIVVKKSKTSRKSK